MGVITNTHLLSAHQTTIRKYIDRYGKHAGIGFQRIGFQLLKNDPRYIQWRKKLLKRPQPWSKGYTKETHPSVARISKTFLKKKIDNFAHWRERSRKAGLFPFFHPLPFERDGKLAFLIGLVLGDGHIAKLPRTQSLTIALGTDKPLLWKHVLKITREVFGKEPYVKKHKHSACMRIRVYQKDISERLRIPFGARKNLLIVLPKWILGNKKFLIACLKGLYEAEGSFCVHKPTYTYKLLFVNKNVSLLRIVYVALEQLGFHPHKSKDKVQISRKEEVYRFKNLIRFRKYI